jgi:voltage-gated potassium channel Kch
MRQATALHALDFYLFRLLGTLSRVGFALLVALALLGLLLGIVGYHQLARRETSPSSTANEIYQALQLFVIGGPSSAKDLPPALDVARYVAAIVSFSAVIGLLGLVFFGQIQAARLWLLGRRHVIICGLGEKGSHLVERLRKDLHFVVIIESDANHEGLAQCRALGAITLIGSSADAWLLKKGRVDRAGVLLALFREDDRLNVETAVRAYELCRGADPRPLTCVVQIADPGLPAVVRKHAMASLENDRFELQIVDAYDACARAMLREAVLGLGRVRFDRLLVVGLDQPGRLGERLILRAARDWHIENPAHAHRPRLVVEVMDHAASRAVAALRSRYAFLDDVCEIHPRDADPGGPASDDRDAWPGEGSGAGPVPDVAFVCLHDEARALVAADRLRALLPAAVPIIVQTIERDAGLGALIRGRAAERLIAVGLKDRLLQIAASLHPVRELLAQAVHQEYVRHRQAQAQTQAASPGPDQPAVALWETLSEDYRAASRAQAEDFKRKLALIGRKAVHVPDGLIGLASFSDEEVERLARDEHERWCAERTRRGWTHGAARCDRKKHHPNLVPWDDPRLDEAARDINRTAIRRLPAILALADYQVVRASTD